jgi:uncharacterized protein involved in exopolysaccharide biosynthesis
MKTFLRPLWRHRFKAAMVFLLAVAAAFGATILAKPRYRSEAQLFVRIGRENTAIDPTATLTNDQRVVTTAQVRETEINSAVAIASSRAIAERVVDQLGSDLILGKNVESGEKSGGLSSLVKGLFSYVDLQGVRNALHMPTTSDRDAAIARVLKDLSVVSVTDSQVVRFEFKSHDAAVAQSVVQELVTEFLTINMSLNRTPQSEEFLVEQSNRLREELNATEQAVRSLKLDSGILTSAYQQQLLSDQISEAESSGAAARREIAATTSEVESLRTALAAVPRSEVIANVAGKPSYAADGMREQLYELEQQEKLLLATYTPDYVEVKHVQQQIENSRSILDQESAPRSEKTTGLNPTFSAIETLLLGREATLTALKSKEKRIVEELGELRQRQEKFTHADSALVRLERDLAIKDESYRTFAGKLVEAQIDRELEAQRISNIGVLQQASLEPMPVSPHPLRNIVIGLLAGCCGAVGVVYLAETAASAVRQPADIEHHVGVPLLLVVPEMRRSQVRSPVQSA